jgi:hypothetical protein
MSAPELRPCPFCGGNASCFEDANHSTAWWFGCYNDQCEVRPCVWAQTKDQATEEWNRRADLPPTDADVMAHPTVKALVEALRKCEDEIDGYIRHEYPGDHPVQDRYRRRDFAANPARIALAAIQEAKP